MARNRGEGSCSLLNDGFGQVGRSAKYVRKFCRTTKQAGQERKNYLLMKKTLAIKPMASLPLVGGKIPPLGGIADLPG